MLIHLLLIILFPIAISAAAQPVPKPVKATEPASKQKEPEKKLVPIDKIVAVIYGPEATEIVTHSDVRRSLDGRVQSLDEVILQRLMVQDALKMRIMTDESAVDDYILKVAKSYGGTLDDINQMFEAAGFTAIEGRRKFAELYAIQQLREYKILSRVYVPEKEVVAYYESNPIVKPASYVIERAVVTATEPRMEETRKKLDIYINTGKGMLVGWHQLPEIKESDLADDKKFITALEVGQIAQPIEFNGGFELYRMKAKTVSRVEPLEDRYREIVEILRRPKAEQLFEEYKRDLWANASILYL